MCFANAANGRGVSLYRLRLESFELKVFEMGLIVSLEIRIQLMRSLTRNLMIRIGMLPRNDGMRLHFMNYQTLRIFSTLAASSNMIKNTLELDTSWLAMQTVR